MCVMRKLVLSFLIAFFISIQLVIAQDFSIDLKMDEYYLAGRTGEIELTINNLILREEWFTISVVGFPQEWVTAEESLLRISPGGSGLVKIFVKPPKDVKPDIYQYFLKVTRVSTGSDFEKELLLDIRQVTSAIIKDLELSCGECLEEVTASGTILNVGSRILDLTLIAKIRNQQKTIYIGKLDMLETRLFETTFSLEDLLPGDYSFDFNLIDASGNSYYTDSKIFKIPVIENVIYDEDVSTTPFGSIVTLKASNEGNAISDAELKSEPEGWYSVFSGPSPTGIIGGQFLWKTSLMPHESASITYSEIYWPTYVIVIIVVFVIVLFIWQSTKFILKKNIFAKTFKRGRHISVSLHIKNRRREIRRAVVRDLVPAGFSVVDKFETVKPLMRKVARGVELIWKIGDLKAHEERVLHYTIKPMIEAVRRVHLPSALMRAVHQRRIHSKRSNRVVLHPEKMEFTEVSVKVTK